MAKKKYNSISFHTEAQTLVDKYLGEIPGFQLRTNSKMITENGMTKQQFIVAYLIPNYDVCSFEFWGIEKSPAEALKKFEKDLSDFWTINAPEEIPALVDFDLIF